MHAHRMTRALAAAALLAAGATAQQTIQAHSFLVLRHGTTTYTPSNNVSAPIAIEEWALSDDGAVGTLLQASAADGATCQNVRGQCAWSEG